MTGVAVFYAFSFIYLKIHSTDFIIAQGTARAFAVPVPPVLDFSVPDLPNLPLQAVDGWDTPTSAGTFVVGLAAMIAIRLPPEQSGDYGISLDCEAVRMPGWPDKVLVTVRSGNLDIVARAFGTREGIVRWSFRLPRDAVDSSGRATLMLILDPTPAEGTRVRPNPSLRRTLLVTRVSVGS